MFELLFCLGIAGAFTLCLAVPYSIFVLFMYIVYKATGGKMKYRDYVKHW